MKRSILMVVAVPLLIAGCKRSESSENCLRARVQAMSLLKQAFTAQASYHKEQHKYGSGPAEVGFAPGHPLLYTYCLLDQCIPCDQGERCKNLGLAMSKCQEVLAQNGGGDKTTYAACALGDSISTDPARPFDVWIMTAIAGYPQNIIDGCR